MLCQKDLQSNIWYLLYKSYRADRCDSRSDTLPERPEFISRKTTRIYELVGNSGAFLHDLGERVA